MKVNKSSCCGAAIGKLFGRSICEQCAQPVVDDIDWSRGVGDPGPIRLPTREEILADSRVLNWHSADKDEPPTDRPFYAAWWLPAVNRWRIYRVEPGVAFWAHYWAEDKLGVPIPLGRMPEPIVADERQQSCEHLWDTMGKLDSGRTIERRCALCGLWEEKDVS